MNPVLPRIAARNLLRQRKRTMLLAGAIAFGIMIVTLINGFAGAFIRNVSENFAYLMGGHVFVSGTEYSPSGRQISVIRDTAVIDEALASSGLKNIRVQKTSQVMATLIFEGKSIRQNLTGIDLGHSSMLRDRLMLLNGTWEDAAQPDALIISEKIAKKLNVLPGDKVIAQFQTITGQNNVGEFRIAGISIDSSFIGSIMAYVQLDYLNSLLGIRNGEYMSLGVMLDRLDQSGNAASALYVTMKSMGLQMFERKVAQDGNAMTPFQAMIREQTRERWEGTKYRVYTIDEILSQARQIVVALDTASVFILIVLFAIVMIGLSNTFRMAMFERIKEIGTMRAIGVQRNEVRAMFLYEALFLALAGAVAGLLLAFLAMAGLSLITFDPQSPVFLILRNGHLSFNLPPLRALFNIALIAALTLAAVYAPANAASKLRPAEALRTVK
ncbi:MAG: FtsX-like permease family protein [Spirochaetales bacterium]|nr:FtsX-like permease family protein [Spirochaetales bacterium]